MLEQIVAERQIIQLAVLERAQSIRRTADNWLLMQVETRVDQAGKARQLKIFMQNLVIARVADLFDELWPGRAIHMNHGRTVLPHPARAVKRDSHELRRVPGAVQILIALVGKLGQSYRRKRHEFRPLEPLVKPIINTAVSRLVEDRSIAKRPWTVFHTPIEVRHHLSLSQKLRNPLLNARNVLGLQPLFGDG